MTQITTHYIGIESSSNEIQQDSAARVLVIQGQLDIYRGHSYTLVQKLAELDAKIADLYQKLPPQTLPSSSSEVFSSTSSSPLSASSFQSRSPSPGPSDSPKGDALLIALSHVDTITVENEGASETRIKIAEQMRDKFRELFERLLGLVQSRKLTISELEKRLESVSVPKPVTAAAASPAPKPEIPDADEEALQALERDIRNIDVSFISNKERDAVMQNLVFFFYEEEMQGKVILDKITESNPALQRAAEKAINVIDAMIPSTHKTTVSQVTHSFMKSKERNLDKKMRIEANKKIDTTTLAGINAVVGQSLTEFAHFYSKLKTEKRAENKAKKSYSDFHFTTIAFLSGELFLIERRFEEAKKLYQNRLGKNSSETITINAQLAIVEKNLRNIQRVKGSFRKLLEKCRVKSVLPN